LCAGHGDIFLVTHVPPFNTSFDRHHVMGTREEDRELLHQGSIGLKLALRDQDVFAAVSGHSHLTGTTLATVRMGDHTV
jgi:Icc-related predicted phosphoesterase